MWRAPWPVSWQRPAACQPSLQASFSASVNRRALMPMRYHIGTHVREASSVAATPLAPDQGRVVQAIARHPLTKGTAAEVAFPRLRVVGHAREQPAQLNSGRELAA